LKAVPRRSANSIGTQHLLFGVRGVDGHAIRAHAPPDSAWRSPTARWRSRSPRDPAREV